MQFLAWAGLAICLFAVVLLVMPRSPARPGPRYRTDWSNQAHWPFTFVISIDTAGFVKNITQLQQALKKLSLQAAASRKQQAIYRDWWASLPWHLRARIRLTEDWGRVKREWERLKRLYGR